MYTLVERGHIYIAQPPLYKLKSGKQETYVKDDHELNEWLVGSALDNASLQRSGEAVPANRSEEHTSELQSLMRISYAVFCLKKKIKHPYKKNKPNTTQY